MGKRTYLPYLGKAVDGWAERAVMQPHTIPSTRSPPPPFTHPSDFRLSTFTPASRDVNRGNRGTSGAGETRAGKRRKSKRADQPPRPARQAGRSTLMLMLPESE